MEELIKISKKYCQKHYSNLEYHNFDHALDVFEVVCQRSKNLSEEEKLLLKLAALFHDVVVEHKEDDEAQSAKKAEEFLKSHLDSQQIKIIEELILSTKMPQNPKTKLQKIICDADLDNLGRDDFFKKGELLRQELGKKKELWEKETLVFLKKHKYHTLQARNERDIQKKKHIKELEKRILPNPKPL